MDVSMSDQDTIRTALTRYQAAVDGDRENRDRDIEDRRFYKGGMEQWDETARTGRAGRPTLTINRLPQFVKQVTGEMRQNKPAIKVLPVDDKTDPEFAKVYSAIIRHIESLSDGHRVYSKAGEQAVIGGIGWFRITSDYRDAKSFEQEIFIRHIRNPLSVAVDPDAIGAVREDMNFAFVSQLMTTAAFKDKYAKASTADFPQDHIYSGWRQGEFIRLAEYWERIPVTRSLALLSDGSTRYVDDLTPDDVAMLDASGVRVVQERDVETTKVQWHLMTANEVLDTGEWVGSFIPLIPIIGEETEIGDEIFRHGLIHHAKDSQRSYNVSSSAAMEAVASQPKAPYIATADMVKNHKAQWEGLNRGNPPVLLYDPDRNAPGARPQREAPPQFPTAWAQIAQIADQDMKATTGIYDASLGKSGNETSGRAIMARDRQGETATYVYVDNLTAGIRHAGRILLETIPYIYSDERVIRMIGEDGSIEDYARINTRLPDGRTWNDVSVGKFDIEVSTGPAYATQRQEAADSMMQFVQAVPNAASLVADLIAKNMDWPGADKIADRLKMALPPGVDKEADEKRAEAAGPQQPNPLEELQVRGAMADIEGKEADTVIKKAQAAQVTGQMQAMIEQAVTQALQQAGFEMAMVD